MQSVTEKYEYQLNIYYGIFFPYDIVDVVIDSLANSKWMGLTSSQAELKANGAVISWSINSDNETQQNTGIIFADEMTISGDCKSSPLMSSLNIDLNEMNRREKKYANAMAAIFELYTFLIREFKNRGIGVAKINYGWQAMTCEWEKAALIPESNFNLFKKLRGTLSNSS